jgi:hypothetical protein
MDSELRDGPNAGFWSWNTRFPKMAISWLWTLTSSSAENPKTFTLAVSLHTSIVHVGDYLVLEVITSNTTDHKVFAAQGGAGGPRVGALE